MTHRDLKAIEDRRRKALGGALLARSNHITRDIIDHDVGYLIKEVEVLRRRLLTEVPHRVA